MSAARSRRRCAPGAEVDGEGDFLIGDGVPAEAVEGRSAVGVGLDAGDADAFPTEAGGLPGEAFPAPRDDGVEADEDEQTVLGEWEDFGDGLEREVGGTLGCGGIDEIGVAAGDGAELAGIGAGEDAGGHGGTGEA